MAKYDINSLSEILTFLIPFFHLPGIGGSSCFIDAPIIVSYRIDDISYFLKQCCASWTLCALHFHFVGVREHWLLCYLYNKSDRLMFNSATADTL